MPLADKPPGAVLRLVLRAPNALYRLHLDRMLGHRFLQLTHKGRRTGAPHKTVLEVVGRDRTTGAHYVAAGWGTKSDWYRNILAGPHVRVRVAGHAFDATARTLDQPEALRVLDDYERDHRIAAREIKRLFGYATIPELAAHVPIIELLPARRG